MLINSAAGEKGYILVMAMVFTLLMSITGLAFLYLGQLERSLTRRAIHSSQSLQLAEAGVERTIWRLRNYPDWRLGPPAHLYTNELLGAGNYSVFLGPRHEHRITVTSTGRAGDRERAIRVELFER